MSRRSAIYIDIMPEFKPGDLPPSGYLEWHEWADVQRKAGIRQHRCKSCGKWVTPQEEPHCAAMKGDEK